MIETNLAKIIMRVVEKNPNDCLASPQLQELNPEYNTISRGRILARKGFN